MSRKFLGSIGMIGVALLQGCSSHAITDTPSSAAAPSSPGASSAALAPKVQNPLPASVFSKHPCDSALTDAQLTQLFGEVPTPRHTDNQAGPGCGWTKESTTAVIDVAWMTGLSGGLSDYYAKKGTDAYQQPVEVGGYPGVEYNSTEANPTVDCGIGVGIADNLVFDVHFIVGTNRTGKLNPCDGVKSIAQDVLDNLKAAAQ